jgi:lipopolysaccharide transport system ATP-binding protein
MNDSVIRVEKLSKRYRIDRRQQHNTLRDVLADRIVSPLQRFSAALRDAKQDPQDERTTSPEVIWALKDVSFDIGRGEVIGIIGHNGAGKTTLLKILSRITKPTDGCAEIRGRVGSLLEVGTGFHSELTGRENIYLNGAILGMKRVEIDLKFDQIVDFSGITKFLDTPVKRYSSGMFVRLAFAVAAHLEPQILMVDEVLAVGDAAFQKKCTAKMDEVSRAGHTVLFVSHNMGLIQSLCQRVIVLRNGSVYAEDTAINAVATYLQTLEETSSEDLLERAARRGQGKVRLAKIEITSGGSAPAAGLITGHPARFIFYVTAMTPGISCSFTIYDQYGQPVTYFDSAVYSRCDGTDKSQGHFFACEIDELLLIPGRYRINAAIMLDGEMQDHLEGAGFFDVQQGKLRGRTVLRNAGYGSSLMPHRWRTPL